MHRRAQLIVDTATLFNPGEVLGREGVATGDVVRSLRRLEQPPPFVVGEQASARHLNPLGFYGGSEFKIFETAARANDFRGLSVSKNSLKSHP